MIQTNQTQTYILIHGAWHGAWCWNETVSFLEAQGKKVIAVDLPGHGENKEPIEEQSLETYANAVAKVLDEQDEPVILVGHSLGGMIITQAAEYRPEKVKSLVYVCAFLPKNGQSNDGPDNGIKPTDWSGLSKLGLVNMSPNGKTTTLTKDFAIRGGFNDLPLDVAEKAFAQMGPEAIASQYQPVQISARFEAIPRVYVRCLLDQSIKIEVQDKMIEASPCEKVYTLNTGHSPFLADPQGLADILLQLS